MAWKAVVPVRIHRPDKALRDDVSADRHRKHFVKPRRDLRGFSGAYPRVNSPVLQGRDRDARSASRIGNLDDTCALPLHRKNATSTRRQDRMPTGEGRLTSVAAAIPAS